MEIESELRQAELILNAIGWCSDEARHDSLLAIAKQILEPYWRKSHPRALWLKSGMPNLGEDLPPTDEVELEERYIELLRMAAEGGGPRSTIQAWM